MDNNDTIELLNDIKRILSLMCLSSVSGLKKQYLTTEKDQKVYDLCTRKTVAEITNEIPDLGNEAVRIRVSLWEKNGLLLSVQEASGRGRPKKYYINVESFLR